MHIYLNVHGMLEQLRQKADTEKTRGPRVSKREESHIRKESESHAIDHGHGFARCGQEYNVSNACQLGGTTWSNTDIS